MAGVDLSQAELEKTEKVNPRGFLEEGDEKELTGYVEKNTKGSSRVRSAQSNVESKKKKMEEQISEKSGGRPYPLGGGGRAVKKDKLLAG